MNSKVFDQLKLYYFAIILTIFLANAKIVEKKTLIISIQITNKIWILMTVRHKSSRFARFEYCPNDWLRCSIDDSSTTVLIITSVNITKPLVIAELNLNKPITKFEKIIGCWSTEKSARILANQT